LVEIAVDHPDRRTSMNLDCKHKTFIIDYGFEDNHVPGTFDPGGFKFKNKIIIDVHLDSKRITIQEITDSMSTELDNFLRSFIRELRHRIKQWTLTAIGDVLCKMIEVSKYDVSYNYTTYGGIVRPRPEIKEDIDLDEKSECSIAVYDNKEKTWWQVLSSQYKSAQIDVFYDKDHRITFNLFLTRNSINNVAIEVQLAGMEIWAKNRLKQLLVFIEIMERLISLHMTGDSSMVVAFIAGLKVLGLRFGLKLDDKLQSVSIDGSLWCDE